MARMQFRVILEIRPVFGQVASSTDDCLQLRRTGTFSCCYILTTESLILAQNEHWRHGLGMQVERESSLRGASTVANG